MKKKNIGFILFGAAGGELISIIALVFIFPVLYEQMGIPLTPIMDMILLIIGLITFFVLIIVGVFLLIKFRNQE